VEVSVAEQKKNMSAQWDIMAVRDIFAKHFRCILDYSQQANMGDAFKGKQERRILLNIPEVLHVS